jgi:hypothetical protein
MRDGILFLTQTQDVTFKKPPFASGVKAISKVGETPQPVRFLTTLPAHSVRGSSKTAKAPLAHWILTWL